MTQLSPGQDQKPTDWGRVFVKLMADLNMSYESILERTFPQVGALLDAFNVETDSEEENNIEPEEEHTIMDGQAFAALFSGLS